MATVALPTLRQSFLARYRLCPYSAHHADLLPDASTHDQNRGTLLHALAAEVVARCVKDNLSVYPPDEAKRLMDQMIRQGGLPIGDQYDTLMGLAYKFAAERSFDIANIVDLEETYSLEIEGALLTGRPDYLAITEQGECEIRDYKSTWATEPEADHDGTFQCRLYAVLAADAYPQIHTFRLVVDWLRWGWDRHSECELSRQEVEEFRDGELAALVAQVLVDRDREQWEAACGSWCATCPVAHHCPLPAELRGDGEITTREEAQIVGEALLPLRKQAKGLTAALRAWCAENGPVVTGDTAWDFKAKSDSYRIRDRETLRNALAEQGLEHDDYFTVVPGPTEFSNRKRETA